MQLLFKSTLGILAERWCLSVVLFCCVTHSQLFWLQFGFVLCLVSTPCQSLLSSVAIGSWSNFLVLVLVLRLLLSYSFYSIDACQPKMFALFGQHALKWKTCFIVGSWPSNSVCYLSYKHCQLPLTCYLFASLPFIQSFARCFSNHDWHAKCTQPQLSSAQLNSQVAFVWFSFRFLATETVHANWSYVWQM